MKPNHDRKKGFLMANTRPNDIPVESPSDGPPPPSANINANGPTGFIAETFDEALGWLARWFQERTRNEQPGDIKDLNNGLTALNRLMDAYKRLKALGDLDPAAGEDKDSEDGWEEILRIVERIAQQQHEQQQQREREEGAEAEEFLPR